jgi:prepilin-type N-terminal cleavage/methylation domain-containing protein
MSERRARAGITLVELLVVLAILAVVTSVATLGVPWTGPPRADSVSAAVEALRAAALASGRATTTVIDVRGQPRALTAFPDGIVIADSALRIDPLTGQRAATSSTRSTISAP